MSLILIVDDSDLLRTMLAESLTSHGYEVAAASRAEKAVEALAKRLPDLIILDIVLPDMDGRDFCRSLRQKTETRHIPVILITGSEQDKVKGFEVGADDYIMKPLDLAELRARIEAVLRRVRQPRPEAGRAAAPAAAGAAASTRPPVLTGPTWRQAAIGLMLWPQWIGKWTIYPPAAAGTLAAALALLLIGHALAPGMTLSSWGLCAAALLLYGVLCTVLVVGSSLLGLELRWQEGTRITALAALPLLLKLLAGVLVAALTSLSPLLISASPVLFFRSAPEWLSRLDLFELWAAYLLWAMLKGRKDSDGKAAVCTAAVWAAGNASVLAIGYMNTAR